MSRVCRTALLIVLLIGCPVLHAQAPHERANPAAEVGKARRAQSEGRNKSLVPEAGKKGTGDLSKARHRDEHGLNRLEESV